MVLVYNAAGNPHQGSKDDARNRNPILFSDSARPAFEHEQGLVDKNVLFVNGPINHLAGSHTEGGSVPGPPDPAFLGTLVEARL